MVMITESGDKIMTKVIITVSGGVADVIEQPDDVEVEIRDYDVEGNWDEDDIGCRYDKQGDRYQEFIFSAEK
jgi:hypothetical protein